MAQTYLESFNEGQVLGAKMALNNLMLLLIQNQTLYSGDFDEVEKLVKDLKLKMEKEGKVVPINLT